MSPVLGSSDMAKASVDVEFSLAWPDGHPRNLSSASLVVTSPGGTNTAMTLSAGVPLKFIWNIGGYGKQSVNSLSIKVTAADEFGLTATSSAVGIKLNYASPISIQPKTTAWLLYILYAVVAILLVLLLVMSRRLRKLASSGAIGRVIQKVRKTIVGGRGRKDKPIAVLKVRPVAGGDGDGDDAAAEAGAAEKIDDGRADAGSVNDDGVGRLGM